jgi:hypothetical protein
LIEEGPVKITAAIACAALISGCAAVPTEPTEPVLAVVTPNTATQVGFESSGLAERRAKQGASVPLVVAGVSLYGGVYGLLVAGAAVATAGVGAAAGALIGTVESAMKAGERGNVQAHLDRTGLVPLLDGAHGHRALRDCFTAGMPASLEARTPDYLLEVEWVSLELRPDGDAAGALDPRFAMSSAVVWRERKWDQTGWRKTGRLVDETRYATANEWSADNGALAWAELHDSCLRLAQQVRSQVDPDNKATLAKEAMR